MHTKIVAMDDRWFIFRQDLYSGGKVYLSAIVRGMAKRGSATINPPEFIAELGNPAFPHIDERDLDVSRRLDPPR